MSAKQVVVGSAGMQAVAAAWAERLKAGDVLFLLGELGAGKTTFTQGLARALGVADTVTSPTFTIMTEYPTTHPTIRRLCHIDLYRLTTKQAVADPMVGSAVQGNPDALTVVEWADRLGDTRPVPTHTLHFSLGENDEERMITT